MPGVTVQYSTFTLQSFTTSSDATWATYICLCRHTKWWKGTPSTPRIISSWRYKKFIHGLNHLQYSSPTLVALIRTLQPKNCATLLDELYLSLPMQNRTRYIHNRVAHTMCKTLMYIHSLLVWLCQSTLRCNHIKDTWSRRHKKPNATKHTTIPSWNNQTVKLWSSYLSVESSFLSTSSTKSTCWFAMKAIWHGIIGHLHLTDALLQPGKLRLTFATNQPRCHSQDSDRSSLHSGHQDVVDFPLKASFPKPRVVCFSSLTEKHLINHRLHQLYTLTSSSNSIISLLVWTWQSAGDTTIKTRNGEVEGPNTPVLLLVPLKGLPVPRTKSLMLGVAGTK